MTSGRPICNSSFGKCKVFETFCEPFLQGSALACDTNGCRDLNAANVPLMQLKQLRGLQLSSHTYKQPQNADNNHHADQEAQIILTPGVVYFIHLDGRIEEREYERYGGDDAVP